MSDTIRPALTDWRLVTLIKGVPRVPLAHSGNGAPWELSTAPEDRHRIAALCLYGQPFGFTAQDVEVLRLLASPRLSQIIHLDKRRSVDACGFYDSLADKIAALLP